MAAAERTVFVPLAAAALGAAGALFVLFLPHGVGATAAVVFWTVATLARGERGIARWFPRLPIFGSLLAACTLLIRWYALSSLRGMPVLLAAIVAHELAAAGTVALAWLARPADAEADRWLASLNSISAILVFIQAAIVVAFAGLRIALILTLLAYIVVRLVLAFVNWRYSGVRGSDLAATFVLLSTLALAVLNSGTEYSIPNFAESDLCRPHFISMARFARVVAPDLPHHVTQRGNYRQDVFFSDADRQTYLTWLKKYATIHRLRIAGYCLMTNHVHLIVVPEQEDSIARTLRRAHARYALYVHAKRGHTGHLWQNRYYSTVMDETHLAAAMRYVETNPVRAGLIEDAVHYGWSSAAAHIDGRDVTGLLDLPYWRARYTCNEWRAELRQPNPDDLVEQIRSKTNSGRPLGGEDFVGELEQRLGRPLTPSRRGRKGKSHQSTLPRVAVVAEIGD